MAATIIIGNFKWSSIREHREKTLSWHQRNCARDTYPNLTNCRQHFHKDGVVGGGSNRGSAVSSEIVILLKLNNSGLVSKHG